MTKRNIAIVELFNRGYRVNEEGLLTHNERIIAGTVYNHYRTTSIRLSKKTVTVAIHRLAGYQKFGDLIFDPILQIRHLDSNSLNNKPDNIGIGTAYENCMDKPPEVRKQAVLKAALSVTIHSHDEVLKLKGEGFSYKQIMKMVGISSKGTLSFIINKSIRSLQKPVS